MIDSGSEAVLVAGGQAYADLNDGLSIWLRERR